MAFVEDSATTSSISYFENHVGLGYFCAKPKEVDPIELTFYVANKSMGKSNTVVSVYTMYRHLQKYCSHHRNVLLALKYKINNEVFKYSGLRH